MVPTSTAHALPPVCRRPLLDPTRLVADPTHYTSAIERNLENRAPLLNWHIKHHSPPGVFDGLTTSGSMLEALVGALQIPGPDQVESQIAEKRRQVAAFKAGTRNAGDQARRAVSKRAAGGKGVELKEALMPMVDVEYKKLIQVRTPSAHPPHTLRTLFAHPAHTPRLHSPHSLFSPSVSSMHLFRTLSAPLPAPLPKPSRTLSTPLPPPQAAWRNPTRAPAILLPGVRTFATVVTWRLSSLTGVGDRRAIMDSALCQTAYTVASCRAVLDPEACYEGSECRDVLDGSCQVSDDSR